ncbi:hypothetical protein RhiJN_20280 [Ceratobasidium sp. AG-Ba]|nr:hypothetical protein RhiJN_20280 [Ceratobasidium sp. AG-Ba]
MIIGAVSPAQQSGTSTTGDHFQVVIWDWRDGTLLNCIGVCPGCCLMTLLDMDTLLLVIAEGEGYRKLKFAIFGHIQATYITPTDKLDSLCILSDYARLSPSLELLLPELGEFASSDPSEFSLDSQPLPGNGSLQTSTFVPNPSRRTLRLYMCLYSEFTDHHDVSVFVNVEGIFKLLSQVQNSEVKSLPWEAWGETMTRWFLVGPDFLYLTGSPVVYGSRAAVVISFAQGPSGRLAMLDFCPSTIRRFPTNTMERFAQRRWNISRGILPYMFLPYEELFSNSSAVAEVVGGDEPTVISAYTTVPIVSRLAYRIVSSPEELIRGDHWTMDGNRVIKMQVCAFS